MMKTITLTELSLLKSLLTWKVAIDAKAKKYVEPAMSILFSQLLAILYSFVYL